MAGVCIKKLPLLAHVLNVLSAAAVNTQFSGCSPVACLYVLLLTLMVYHSLNSKFVPLAGHIMKNNLISVFLLQFCLPMILLFRSAFVSFRLCLRSPHGLRLQFPYTAHLCVFFSIRFVPLVRTYQPPPSNFSNSID
jgi:hypothetical protein